MRYDSFSYLWPPRPETAVSPDMLHVLEKRGLVAQPKKNGTCSVIFVSPNKTVSAMNRHSAPHRGWTPTPEVMADFANLPGEGWYVFVAELLHNKVPHIKNVNYVHDILVRDGEYLVRRTQEERQDMLHELFIRDTVVETPTHYVVSRHLWLPVEYESGFAELFGSLTADEDEGIVLKDPKQKLSLCSRQKSNTVGQIKCRRPHKNYSF